MSFKGALGLPAPIGAPSQVVGDFIPTGRGTRAWSTFWPLLSNTTWNEAPSWTTGRIYWQPARFEAPGVITDMVFECYTLQAASNARLFVYECERGSWCPGERRFASGNISTATTGLKQLTNLEIVVRPGRHVIGWSVDTTGVAFRISGGQTYEWVGNAFGGGAYVVAGLGYSTCAFGAEPTNGRSLDLVESGGQFSILMRAKDPYR